MAAKIKLKRIGKKKRPFYRVIIQDESSSRRGKAIDLLGTYDPLLQDSKFNVDKAKVLEWISKGAKPTDSVRVLLGKAGILPPVSFEGKTRKKPKSEAGKEEGTAPTATSEKKPEAPKKAETPKAEEKPVEAPKKEEKPKAEEPKAETKPEPKPEAKEEEKEKEEKKEE